MDFIIGSELELCFATHRLGGCERWDEASRALKTELTRGGFSVGSVNDHNPATKYQKWSIHYDGSIENDYSPAYMTVELVSPCLPLPAYGTEIMKMWNFLGVDVITNTSTGYHHGLSFVNPDLNRKLSRRRAIFGHLWATRYEAEEITRWNRESNAYCASLAHRAGPQSRFQSSRVDSWRELERRYDIGKYATLNFGKLTGGRNPYVECRVMGNTNYHRRHNDVFTTLSRVMELMEETVDDSKVESNTAMVADAFSAPQYTRNTILRQMMSDD